MSSQICFVQPLQLHPRRRWRNRYADLAKPLRVREWHGYHFFQKERICKRLTKKVHFVFVWRIDTISYNWHLGMYMLQDVTSFEPTCFVPAEPCCLEAPFKPRQLPLAEVSMALGRVAQNSPPKFTSPAGAWFFQTRQVAVWGFPLWGEGGFLDSCILYCTLQYVQAFQTTKKDTKKQQKFGLDMTLAVKALQDLPRSEICVHQSCAKHIFLLNFVVSPCDSWLWCYFVHHWQHPQPLIPTAQVISPLHLAWVFYWREIPEGLFMIPPPNPKDFFVCQVIWNWLKVVDWFHWWSW